MKKLLITALAALPLCAVADHHEAVEGEIRAMELIFNDAYGANDHETYLGIYADDASIIFDGARHPVASYAKDLQAMRDAGDKVEANEMSDIRIQVSSSGESAIATYILETVSRSADGAVSTVHASETDVWQKIDGDWKIVSLHYTEIVPAE